MKLMEVRGKYEKGPPAVEEMSEAKFIRRRGTLKRRRRTLKLRRGTLKRRRSFNFSDPSTQNLAEPKSAFRMALVL
jgi:hypothetical protein